MAESQIPAKSRRPGVSHTSTYQTNYQAENLVKSDGYKKWKTAKSGEKSGSVTLQLEKASKIHQIDIGNENSAFVEVLVGKTDMQDQDFQVLLVASSFMNPMESRGGQNGSRVRMFTSDSLSKTAKDQKWDRIKLVCTQPFNKGIQYGLSFVKLHSPPEAGEEAGDRKQKQIKLGAFAIKTDNDDDDISAGSLFAKRKEKKETVPLTGAAAVRAASKLANESQPGPSKTPNRTAPTSTFKGDTPGTSKVPTPKRRHSPEPEKKIPKHIVTSPVKLHKQSTSLSSVSSSTSSKVGKGTPPLKRVKTEPPKPSKEKEFSKMMEKVIFVMSGFQNPFRSELRDKALEMGATYKPDWGKNCTHLICAFESTPKYNQVRGKGKIVKKEWLLDCYKSKKLLPWRKYRLGKARTPPGSTDESSDDEYMPVQKKKTPSKNVSSPKEVLSEKAKDKDYDGSTDDFSGMDTEDELEKIKIQSKENNTPKSPVKVTNQQHAVSPTKNTDDMDDIYNKSTDEEIENDSYDTSEPRKLLLDDLTDLPDLFSTKRFFFFGKFSQKELRTLRRYIIAYDGAVEDYMNDKVCYVITDIEWDKNFDSALADNPGLSFVKSQWIYSCHDKQKFLPHQKYVVAPQA